MVYFCEGGDQDKLDWFRVVNIAGVELAEQELRNAVYTGEWLTNAKSIFSKNNCAAYNLAKDYVKGVAIRQDILETALRWISKGEIERYMSLHQCDQNANELWTYFRNVVDWVKLTFTAYRKEMKDVNWGPLYDNFGKILHDTVALEARVQELMTDEDVTRKKGIYPYVLTGDERTLSIRAFPDSMKRGAYERQEGKCVRCGAMFELSGMEADHITPWKDGGRTIVENCQLLCRGCNRTKGST
jgi:hypothetical protein